MSVAIHDTNTAIEVGWAVRRLSSMRIVEDRKMADAVVSLVAAAFGLSSEKLLTRALRREKLSIFARQIAMKLLREKTALSMPRIALLFGVADHTTVMYAERKLRHLEQADVEIRWVLERLRSQLHEAVS